MIYGVNMLLEDVIAALSFLQDMSLSVSKIGLEGPSTVLEDMEKCLECMIDTHFFDLEARPLVQL